MPHVMDMAALKDRDLLSPKEATALGYGARSTLDLWVRQGKINKYKVGANVRYRRDELDALVVRRVPTPLPGQDTDEAAVKAWARTAAAQVPVAPSRETVDIIVTTIRDALERRAARQEVA